MEVVGSLVSIAVIVAIVYAFAKAAWQAFSKAALAPIHEKLDRILALQQPALQSKTADTSVDAGST